MTGLGCTASCSKLSLAPSGRNTRVLSKMMGSPILLVRSASRNGPTNRLSDKNLWACPRNHHSPPGEPSWSLAGLIVRTVCRCAHVYAGWCRPLMSGRPPVFPGHHGRVITGFVAWPPDAGWISPQPCEPPRMEEDESEVEPYSVEEVQCLLLEANKRRNSARWMLALALGLRQGETLGLRWADVDLDNEYLKLRRHRLRPRYEHGCPEASPYGRKAGYCRPATCGPSRTTCSPSFWGPAEPEHGLSRLEAAVGGRGGSERSTA